VIDALSTRLTSGHIGNTAFVLWGVLARAGTPIFLFSAEFTQAHATHQFSVAQTFFWWRHVLIRPRDVGQ